MTIPSPDRWATLSPLLDELLDLAEPQRAARLAALRAQDPALADELQALLTESAQAASEGFLAGAVPMPAQALASLAGQHLGPYLLEEALGQGGGGSVWRARREDGRFEGAVAIKLLHLSLLGRAGAERFRREGHILALLKHPHIASLLDAGVTAGGQPYLVLELVQGERIDRHCDALSLSIEARLALFSDVLAAVAHAHTHGVIHRDLKPGNILVTHEGQVKLLDFGVAKLLADEAGSGESTELTREGGRALTPEYAAPEQLRGEGVTTATDVYALGVLLYQLLCGQHPTAPANGSAAEALRATLDTEPTPASRRLTLTDQETATRRASNPQRLQRTLTGDLDTIVAHALRKAPGERYATVAALAEDLRRYRDHEPVIARPDSMAYRTRKFVRRHRGAVAAGLLTSLAIVAGVAGTVWQAQRAQAEAVRAKEQRDVALEKMAESQDITKLLSLLTTAMPAQGQFTRDALIDAAVHAVEKREDLDARRKANMLLALSEAVWYAGRDLDLALRLSTQAHGLVRGHANPMVRATAACPLAAQLSQKNRSADARALITQSLKALDASPRHAPARISCLINAADLAIDQGQGAEALVRIEEALLLLPTLELADLSLERNVWSRVAQARRVANQFGPALAAYEHLEQVDQRLGAEASALEGTRLNNWAVTLRAAGRPAQALTKLQRVAALFGNDDSRIPPATLTAMADAHLQLDQAEKAWSLARRAQEISQASGNAPHAAVAVWVQIGALQQLGRKGEALALLDELERTNRKTLPPTFYWFGMALGMRALLADAPALAAPLHDQSVQHQEASRSIHLVRALLQRAAFARSQGKRQAARSDADRAMALLKAVLGDDLLSRYTGEAEYLLAQLAQDSSQGEEARKHFAQAARHFASALGPDHAKTLESLRAATPTGLRH